MNATQGFQYFEKPDFQYLQVPYKGKELAMDVILPKKGVSLSKIEQDLNNKAFSDLVANAKGAEIQLSFPKFKAEFSLDLGELLSKMGMPLAFDPAKANFKGIRYLKQGETLSISKVLHKAFVEVNEEGTEAAAATAVVMMLAGAPPPPIEFKADRPFLYFIRHVKTGAILFMGRFSKP
jgi:serpin B